MKRIIMIVCFWAVMLPVFTNGQQIERKTIESVDDLPRYTYAISGKVSELYADREAFHEFTTLVRADVEKDLATYDIQIFSYH